MLLLEHDDEHATLAAAMAFVDSCCCDAAGGEARADPLGVRSVVIGGGTGGGGGDSVGCEDGDTVVRVSGGRSPSSASSVLTTSDSMMSSSSSSSCADDSDAACRTALQLAHRKRTAHQHQHTRRPSAPAPPTARRVRKLNKTVILELREQVGLLTTRLKELRERRAGDDALATRKRLESEGCVAVVGATSAVATSGAAGTGAGSDSGRQCVGAKGDAGDLEAAMRELRRLQDAKMLNLQLKEAWTTRLRLTEELKAIMAKQTAIARSSSELLKVASVEEQSFAMLHDDATVVRDPTKYRSEFDSQLVALYRQTDAISAYISLRDTSRAFSSSRVYQDYPIDQTFEFVTSTPLKCSLDDIQLQMWRMLAHSNGKTHMCSEDREILKAHQHRCTQTLECKFGAIEVEIVMTVRRFVERHRVVFVSVSHIALNETDLQFQDLSWMILDQHPDKVPLDAPAPTTVLQTCYRLHPVEPSRPRSAMAKANASYFEDFILQAQSERMRTGLLQLQSILMKKFGAVGASAVC